jgi:hypothetical protein
VKQRAVTVPTEHAVATLKEVESEIKELLDTGSQSRQRLCECLGLIERRKLYRAIGARNFKEYLKRQRISIPYQTAQQYASIGQVLEDEAGFLSNISFDESDGLCKLRLLQAALRRHSDRDEVARHLKTDSFRRFREFAQGARPVVPIISSYVAKGQSPAWARVYFDDDTVRVTSDDGRDRDLIWLNPDAFATREQYEDFVQMTMALVHQSGGVKWPYFRSLQAQVS